MTLVDNAIYLDGKRVAAPATLEETFEELDRIGGVAWIGLYRPDEEELRAVAAEFNLHELAVEDAIQAHQRAKVEYYQDTRFIVLCPAAYDDANERVVFGEVHLFVGPNFVVTVRHAERPDLAQVRAKLEANPDRLALGPEAIVHGILDQVVDEYQPVVAGLLNDIDEIEDQLFTGDRGVSRRIYELTREVIAFQRAVNPIAGIVHRLITEAESHDDEMFRAEIVPHLRDVLDHAIKVATAADSYRDLLSSALQVHATLVAQEQNDQVQAMTQASYDQGEQTKKVSAWAAILFTPTVIGGVYGMNFDRMPELHWAYGYPLALGLMFGAAFVLYLVFKKQRWL